MKETILALSVVVATSVCDMQGPGGEVRGEQVAPLSQVSVKLVAQAGIGTVASGVAKANADVIQVCPPPLLLIRSMRPMPWHTVTPDLQTCPWHTLNGTCWLIAANGGGGTGVRSRRRHRRLSSLQHQALRGSH